MIAALPAATVRKIKSGQVISDVRSVVKELVENSLDAGATCVRVNIGDNCGLDGVVVADDGCGIGEADRPLCAREHATSKLPDYDGLASLATFGFRGEALYAMRQSSRAVTILTRSSSDPSPVEFILTGSRDSASASSDAAAGTSPGKDKSESETLEEGDLPSLQKTGVLDGFTTGTAVRITQLWARHPVRLEYLRNAVKQQPAREIKRLTDLMMTYSLARPDVRFELSFSEKSKAHPFKSGPCKDLAGSIESVYGPLLFDELQHVHYSNAGETVCIDGYLPAKAGQQMVTMRKFVNIKVETGVNDRMFTFVNGRPVELPKITRYITAICRKWFCSGRKAYPFICLNISLPHGTFVSLQSYDVNVSPDKKKVLLQDDEMLLNCVKEITNELYPVRVTPVEEDEGDDDSVDSSSSQPLSGVLSQRLKDVASVGISRVSVGGQRLLTYAGLLDEDDDDGDEGGAMSRTTAPISRIAPDIGDMDVSQPREFLKKDGSSTVVVGGMKRPSPSPSSSPLKASNSTSNSDSPVAPSPAKLVAEAGLRDRLYGRDSVAAAAASASAYLPGISDRRHDIELPVTSLSELTENLPNVFQRFSVDDYMVISDYSTTKQLSSPTFGHALSVVGMCQAPAASTWCFIIKEALSLEQWNLWLLPYHRAEECISKKQKLSSESDLRPSLQRGEQLLAAISKEHQTHCVHRKPLFVPFCTVYLRRN